jgi:hypothetical protein
MGWVMYIGRCAVDISSCLVLISCRQARLDIPLVSEEIVCIYFLLLFSIPRHRPEGLELYPSVGCRVGDSIATLTLDFSTVRSPACVVISAPLPESHSPARVRDSSR